MFLRTSASGPTLGRRRGSVNGVTGARHLSLLQNAARVPRIALVVAGACLSAAGVASLFHREPCAALSAVPRTTRADLALEAFAQEFTNQYLSWDPAIEERRRATLASLLPADMELDAGITVPAGRSNQVLWSIVVGDVRQGSHRDITVAARTSAGLMYVAVEVARDRKGQLRLVDYPAMVGGPPIDRSRELPSGEPVTDAALEATARRALGNYLAGRRDALVADLAPGSFVSPPIQPMTLGAVDQVTWAHPGRQIAVLVHARRQDGVGLTLRYRLDVVRRAGRWFVQAVEGQASGREVFK